MIGHAVTLQKRPNRKVWLAKRRRGITATDVPAILGLSEWSTPVDVWLDKHGLADPTPVNYAMARGSLLESLLLTEYAISRKAALLPVPVLAGHPDTRWAMASLDGAARYDDGSVRIVECKTASWRERDDWWDDTKQIPDAYLAQVAWQQFVCGVDEVDVIADVAGDVRIVGPIRRSPDFEAYVVPRMWAWWETHIIGGQEPPVDPVRDYDAMNLLWKPEPGTTTAIDADTAARVREYAALAAQEKQAADGKKELRGLVRQAMGTATRLMDEHDKSWAAIDKRGVLTIKPPKDTTDPTQQEEQQ